MAGGRRTRRTVRLTVATSLISLSAVIVLLALASALLVGTAAVLAVVLGACATRIVHREVVETRFQAAVERASLARSFQAVVAAGQDQHRQFTVAMAAKVRSQGMAIDTLVDRLHATSRRAEAAEQRADGAERRVDGAERRAEQERARANDARARLAAVLDEVFGTTLYDVDAEGAANESTPARDLRALADLARPLRRVS